MAGIYIHVPFCKKRCVYCDFYSTTDSELSERYVQAVCKELTDRQAYLSGEPVKTIYFGGGTPTQLSGSAFKQLFDTIERVYGMDACEEITLEANPDDLTPAYLADIASLPFNRISIGVQTFDDATLKLLQRRHTAHQAVEAVANCRRAGFRNISIDLIYGLPGESFENWQADLKQALELKAEHISAYHLIYEEGTILYTMLKNCSVHEVDEEDSNRFFAALIDTLTENGYEHYEISNFSLPGKQSMHNSSYWNGTIYLGCGPSAHSYDGNGRQWNSASLIRYIEGIENNLCITEKEILELNDRYNDLIITSLRTRKGLSIPLLEKEFGKAIADECLLMANPHLTNETLEILGDYLRLTRKGIFVSDGIMSDLLRV